MSPINVYNQRWLSIFKIWGLAFPWPFILYRYQRWDVPTSLRRHEEFHWKHQLTWLVIPWYIIYGVLYLFYGYKNHPWEIMAREAEQG